MPRSTLKLPKKPAPSTRPGDTKIPVRKPVRSGSQTAKHGTPRRTDESWTAPASPTDPKPPKTPRVAKAAPDGPQEELVVFAFRLTREERDLIHGATGPSKASKFVRTLAVAGARKDEDAIKEILAGLTPAA